MISETITFNFDTEEQRQRFHDRLKSDRSSADALRKGLSDIKDELNMLAEFGAVPMWTSLIGRLDDLVETVLGK